MSFQITQASILFDVAFLAKFKLSTFFAEAGGNCCSRASTNGALDNSMSSGSEENGGKIAKGKSRKAVTMNSASNAQIKQGGQGRVKDPSRDKRLAANRSGPTGQGRVKDNARDKRLAQNRPGPTGQGRVKNPENDRRLSVNREGPTGQGRVKDPTHDRRLSENRPGPTGQGRVKNPSRDKRLRDNRTT